jgi:DNA-binding response OmpR family regulator
VLVVEDQLSIRSVLAEYLAGEGYSTTAAPDIRVARAFLATVVPAVIVFDLMLPGQNGLDFLRERRSDDVLSAIPVVAISAGGGEQLARAERLGADACLAKPFDLDALSAVVRAVCAR